MRRGIKTALGALQPRSTATGATLLIYHRIGGGTADELDTAPDAFARQLQILDRHDVVSLDTALDRLDAGDARPGVVLTFDDGFADVYHNAWPLLRQRGLPFTIYLASAYIGRPMKWEGSTAKGTAGLGITWGQLSEMVDSGLCTVGNHTHNHVRPEELTVADVDACNEQVQTHLGVQPQHFTYPWGIPVTEAEPWLRDRFRSASTGTLGRNQPDADRLRLRRVPVRRSDPESFFAAKLVGHLLPERVYGTMVRTAKALGARG